MRDDVQVIKRTWGFINFGFAILKVTVWSLLIVLIVNCVMWHIQGYKKLINNLDHTYQTQITAVAYRNPWMSSVYKKVIRKTALVMTWSMTKTTSLLDDVPYIHAVNKGKTVQKNVNTDHQALFKFINVIAATFKIVTVKLLSVFISLWVLVFACLLGAMDGLLSRYIRTCEGGRESTFIFHHIKDVVIKIPVLIMLLYLTFPVCINPEIIVLAISALLFIGFYISTANLKKYL